MPTWKFYSFLPSLSVSGFWCVIFCDCPPLARNMLTRPEKKSKLFLDAWEIVAHIDADMKIQDIINILENQMESDLPDKVLEALKPFDGKPITTRLLKVLPGGAEKWRLRRDSSMTYLGTDQFNSDPLPRVTMVLAYSSMSVPLNLQWVETRNGNLFFDRRQRNADRRAILANSKALEQALQLFNDCKQAVIDMKEAKLSFDDFTAPGYPFSHDSIEWAKLCGLYNDETKTIRQGWIIQ